MKKCTNIFISIYNCPSKFTIHFVYIELKMVISLLVHLLCNRCLAIKKKGRENQKFLPATSFSSSSASSLRSCSFPTGCVAGTVTPGICGRQHGGVRARGEFRQSKRNFLS